MQAELPFFECAEDALKSAVQSLGGMKAVGARLWPDKTPDNAGRLLADCLNTSRPEKLDISQVMRILAWAREAGCFAPMQWISSEVGYESRPIAPSEQEDRLVAAIESASKTMASASAALERLQRVRAAA